MAVGTVTINASGTGGAQSGTITTAGGGGTVMVCNDTDSPITYSVKENTSTVKYTNQRLEAKAFTRVTGLANGNVVLYDVSTAHGTSAQNGEIVYLTLAS